MTLFLKSGGFTPLWGRVNPTPENGRWSGKYKAGMNWGRSPPSITIGAIYAVRQTGSQMKETQAKIIKWAKDSSSKRASSFVNILSRTVLIFPSYSTDCLSQNHNQDQSTHDRGKERGLLSKNFAGLKLWQLTVAYFAFPLCRER